MSITKKVPHNDYKGMAKKALVPLFCMLAVLSILYITLISTQENCDLSFSPEIINVIHYSTENGVFSYAVYPEMGRDLEMMEAAYEDYFGVPFDSGTIKVYRTTRKNWCNVGNWYYYLSMREWRVPFKEI